MMVGKPVRQIAHAVVARSWKFAIPRNGVGRNLSALHQRSHHVGLGDQRIDHQASVVHVDRADKAPIAGPRVHLDLGETSSHALVRSSSFAAGNAAARLADRAIVGFNQRGEGRSLRWVILRRNDSIANLKRFRARLADAAAARASRSFLSLSAALQIAAPCNVIVLPPNHSSLDGAISVSPQIDANSIAGREAQHLRGDVGQRGAGVRSAVGKRHLHGHVAVGAPIPTPC